MTGLLIRDAIPADFDAIALQRAQLGDEIGMGRSGLLIMVDQGPAFTVERAGEILLIAGLMRIRDDYATAWTLIAENAGPVMTALTRAVRRVLDASAFRRIDMLARGDFAAAHKWAALLGFAHEGRMAALGRDGSDFDLYAIVRRDRMPREES